MYLVAGVAVFLWLWRVIGPPLLDFRVHRARGRGGRWLDHPGAAARRSGRTRFLWIMAIAAENAMPLAAAVEAFADQYGRRSRKRIMELAYLLNGGTSLPEALASNASLRREMPSCSPGSATRPGACPRPCGSRRRPSRPGCRSGSPLPPGWRICCFMLLALQTILGFLLYFIMPKFESMFSDFGLPLPWISIIMVEATSFVINYFYPFAAAPLVELALLIFLPFSFINWGRLRSSALRQIAGPAPYGALVSVSFTGYWRQQADRIRALTSGGALPDPVGSAPADCSRKRRAARV